MKTITEFNAATLAKVSQTQKDLTAAGKTPEEMPAAMAEATKMSEDKLKHAAAAAEAVGEKLKDFKRVVVLQLAEGETAPSGALVKDGHAYVSEYYSQMVMQKPEPKAERGRGGRGDRGDRKGPPRGKRGGDRDRAPRDSGTGPDASASPARTPGQPLKVIKKPGGPTPATT